MRNNTANTTSKERHIFLLLFLVLAGLWILSKDVVQLKALSGYASNSAAIDFQSIATATTHSNSTLSSSSPLTSTSTSSSISSSRRKNSSSTSKKSHDTKKGRKEAISILPSKMKVKYHEMWNHTSNTIDVPEQYKYPFGRFRVDNHVVGDGKGPMRMTSLEILQSVLHDSAKEHQNEYLAVDDYITGRKNTIPKCLLPDIQATRKLANEIMKERRECHQQRERERRTTVKNSDNDDRNHDNQEELLLLRKGRKELQEVKGMKENHTLTEKQILLPHQMMLSLPILNVGYVRMCCFSTLTTTVDARFMTNSYFSIFYSIKVSKSRFYYVA